MIRIEWEASVVGIATRRAQLVQTKRSNCVRLSTFFVCLAFFLRLPEYLLSACCFSICSERRTFRSLKGQQTDGLVNLRWFYSCPRSPYLINLFCNCPVPICLDCLAKRRRAHLFDARESKRSFAGLRYVRATLFSCFVQLCWANGLASLSLRSETKIG